MPPHIVSIARNALQRAACSGRRGWREPLLSLPALALCSPPLRCSMLADADRAWVASSRDAMRHRSAPRLTQMARWPKQLASSWPPLRPTSHFHSHTWFLPDGRPQVRLEANSRRRSPRVGGCAASEAPIGENATIGDRWQQRWLSVLAVGAVAAAVLLRQRVLRQRATLTAVGACAKERQVCFHPLPPPLPPPPPPPANLGPPLLPPASQWDMMRLKKDPRFKEVFPEVVEEEQDEREVTVRLKGGEQQQ